MATSSSYLTKKFTLNNGVQMPAIGLGTYRIRNSTDIMNAVDYALDAGYRMFDTAAVYGNESHLKNAFKVLLPKYELERKDIFITTKLSPTDHGGDDIIDNAYWKSLKNLDVNYVDLYLIHFPGSARIPAEDKRNVQLREDTWYKLTELYDEGKMRAIGVSNFTVSHLSGLMKYNSGIVPAVNQVEWHPYYYQNELLNYCTENSIVLQAYCSFGGTSSSNNALMNDPIVVNVAKNLGVTPAQVLLVWALQQNIAVIPKSTNAERIKENIQLDFKIPSEDMYMIGQLGELKIKYAWDPSTIP